MTQKETRMLPKIDFKKLILFKKVFGYKIKKKNKIYYRM